MGKKLLLLYLSLPLLVLSSCGGEASTATFNRMSKNQFVTIGSVPFEGPLLHERSQVWVGPDAELGRLVVERIAEALEGEDEIEGRWIGMQHGTLATTLANSEVDIAMGVFGITEARKELVAFSEPYYTSDRKSVV